MHRSALPEIFPSPFDNQPHPLAADAAADLQKRLPSLTQSLHDFSHQGGGKMLGVLVVSDADGKLDYLAGFSGMLGGRWVVDGFVPPVFDQKTYIPLLQSGEAQLEVISSSLADLQQSKTYKAALESKVIAKQQAETGVAELAEQHLSLIHI